MTEIQKLLVCPTCNLPVPSEAPHGLCPRCILSGAATDSETFPDHPSGWEPPEIGVISASFPQLEILELLGRGGMGFVFKARQPELDRLVALKLLPEVLAKDPRFAERFHREGRVLARLHHPGIVSIFDFGRAGDFYYLLMEYVDGVNLRQAMKAGRFSPAEALGIVPKICEALQYAHTQGVLHRDIKPENILLDSNGRVKIADFGIAKLVDKDSGRVTLTATGSTLGTPHYMAPEQLEQPSQVDHRADIYSLGVVLYEMLTGELPIGRFAPPSSKTPVGTRVDEVVFRTLEKDRSRRFQSIGEMQTRVEALGSGAPGGTDAPQTKANDGYGITETDARGPRWRWIAAMAGIAVAAVLLLAIQYGDSRSAPAWLRSIRSMVWRGSPGITVTFTAVEIRNVQGKRWIAVDYLDDVHGNCEKSLPWESSIPGFSPVVRTSEYEDMARPSAGIRHQRVEYSVPDLFSEKQLQELREDLEEKLLYKPVRLSPGESKLLVELEAGEVGSFRGWFKVMLPQKKTQ